MSRKYKQPDQYELLKNARNKYTFELNSWKQRLLSQKVIDFEGDSRNVSLPDIGADEFVGILLHQ